MVNRKNGMQQLWRRHALIRLLVRHAAIGFGLATLAMGVLLFADPGGIGRLLRDNPPAIALLWFFLGLTLGSVQMGMAIMDLGEED